MSQNRYTAVMQRLKVAAGALALVARKELELREAEARDRTWPAEDIAAWRAIAAMFEQQSFDRDTDWPPLVAAARAAEDRRIAAAIAAQDRGDPKLPALAQRLVDVANIRRTLERAAWRVGQCLPARLAA